MITVTFTITELSIIYLYVAICHNRIFNSFDHLTVINSAACKYSNKFSKRVPRQFSILYLIICTQAQLQFCVSFISLLCKRY